jgi:hypothetical protein
MKQLHMCTWRAAFACVCVQKRFVPYGHIDIENTSEEANQLYLGLTQLCENSKKQTDIVLQPGKSSNRKQIHAVTISGFRDDGLALVSNI